MILSRCCRLTIQSIGGITFPEGLSVEYVDVIDEINREVSKLNALALLLARRSEIMEGVTSIILDSVSLLYLYIPFCSVGILAS